MALSRSYDARHLKSTAKEPQLYRNALRTGNNWYPCANLVRVERVLGGGSVAMIMGPVQKDVLKFVPPTLRRVPRGPGLDLLAANNFDRLKRIRFYFTVISRRRCFWVGQKWEKGAKKM